VLREALRQPSGATAARDSVSALTDLLNAQNDFLSIWVNYEVLRRGLDLDLGTLQLDDRGLWIDPGPVGPDFAAVVAERIPLGDDGAVIEMWESEGVIPEYRHSQPGSGPQPGVSPAPTPAGAPGYYDEPARDQSSRRPALVPISHTR
jgi:hypothetical protein